MDCLEKHGTIPIQKDVVLFEAGPIVFIRQNEGNKTELVSQPLYALRARKNAQILWLSRCIH